MRRIFIASIAALALAGAAAGGGYWYLLKNITPDPVPNAVLEAEAALGFAETVGLFHFDVGHAVEIERAILGPEDRAALTGSLTGLTTGPKSLVAALIDAGADPRRTVDHLVAAAIAADDRLAMAGVLIGSFQVDRIVAALSVRYGVEHTTIAGKDVLLVTETDPDSCMVSGPYMVMLAAKRIVIADPGIMGELLERLQGKARAEIDLGTWRSFREGRVMSLALLAPPMEIARRVPHPLVQMTVPQDSDGLSSVEAIYAGLAFAALPPRLVAMARVDGSDPAWAASVALQYATWRAGLAGGAARDVPSLARLAGHLEVTAEHRRLTAQVGLDKDLLGDLARVPAEYLSLAFRDLGMEPREADRQAAPQEQLLPPGEVIAFMERLALSDLKPFDPALDSGFADATAAGPFVVRINAFRLVDEDSGGNGSGDLVEIEFDALSGALSNLSNEPMHHVPGAERARLAITQVTAADGRQLLRDEPCGAERNDRPAELQAASRSLFVDGEFIQVPVVAGSKSVRLVSGAGVNDIARIAGRFELRLPTATENVRIEAPFAGQTVEIDAVRILLKEGAPGTVSYEISGAVDRVLGVRAVNAEGRYLRSVEAYGSGRLLGTGKSISKSFAGVPAAVEFIVATEEATATYPFEITNVAPHFDVWDRPEPFLVATATAGLLQDPAIAIEYGDACAEIPGFSDLGPFRLCPDRLDVQWGAVRGRFQVLGPNHAALHGNLSALELKFDRVGVLGDAESEVLEASQFLSLREVYDQAYLEDTPWISVELPETLADKTITSVKGRLVARVSQTLTSFSLDVSELGGQATHASGLEARLTGFANGALQFDIIGPRERIVQFIPRDGAGRALAIINARLEAGDAVGSWRGSVSVSGRPSILEIVVAESQETVEYGFEFPLGGSEQ